MLTSNNTAEAGPRSHALSQLFSNNTASSIRLSQSPRPFYALLQLQRISFAGLSRAARNNGRSILAQELSTEREAVLLRIWSEYSRSSAGEDTAEPSPCAFDKYTGAIQAC
ncbi:hypothetical protein F2P79_004410 [Pimephales promelas]|nr:hypothetical protein F2P79_004410 [Pimephales promelas]